MVICDGEDGKVLHAVSMRGETGRTFVVAVFDPEDATIVTVLPRAAAKRALPEKRRPMQARCKRLEREVAWPWRYDGISGEAE
jgi:hypothetical protein